MSITRNINQNRIVITTCSGRITLEDAMASLYDLSRYVREDHTLFEMVLNRKNSWIDIDFDHAQTLIVKTQEFFSKLKKGYFAFVGEDDNTFGTCRQFASQVETETIIVDVFRDENSALEWLIDAMNEQYHVQNA